MNQQSLLLSENASQTLYCKACTHENICAEGKPVKQSTGIFNVINPNYSCEDGKKQDQWFINLKKSLCRHLVKLIHHQRSAIYDLMH